MIAFTAKWLAFDACVSARHYLATPIDIAATFPSGETERAGDGHAVRDIAFAFSAADVKDCSVEQVQRRIRYSVRDSLGLHPMVDCFRFDVDGY